MTTPRPTTHRRSFISDARSVLGGNFVAILTTVVTSILINRSLGPELKGVLVAVLVYPTLIASLGELGIRQSTVHELGRRQHGEQAVIGAVASLFLITSLLGTAAGLVVFLLLDNPAFSWPMMALALANIPITFLRSYSQGILLGREMIRQFSRTRWIAAFVMLTMTWLLVWQLRLGVNGAQIAQLLGFAPVVVYALVLVWQIAPPRPRWEPRLMLRLLWLGLTYAVALFVIHLNYRISVVALERLAHPEELGQFSVGNNIVELIWEIPAAVGIVVFSRSANATSGVDFSRRLGKLLRVAIVACLVAGAGIAIVAPVLIPFVYGDEFAPSVKILQWMLPGALVMVLFKVLNTDLAGKGRPYIALFCCLPGLAVNVALSWLLVPQYGGQGAAIATSISYAIMNLLFLLAYSRSVAVPITELFHFRRTDFDWLQRLVAKWARWTDLSK
jgi:O-antigen/teichoic acid export membrane protein